MYWTLVTVALLLLPATVQLGFGVLRALYASSAIALREAFTNFTGALAVALIHLTFLAHQMMLSVDAIVRSISRSFFSGRHLLEWETAAQAESGSKRNSLDVYLRLSPVLAIVLGGCRGVGKSQGAVRGGACAAAVAQRAVPGGLAELAATARGWAALGRRQGFLRSRRYASGASMLTSLVQNYHWLVPDHVEEKGFHPVRLLTPTNIGMLLNARLAAYEFGFITLPEFVAGDARLARELRAVWRSIAGIPSTGMTW